jgi:hypothetical protein
MDLHNVVNISDKSKGTGLKNQSKNKRLQAVSLQPFSIKKTNTQ